MSRLPFVPEAPEDPRVRDAFDRLRRRWQGAPVLHLYRLIGWAPALLAPWMEFARAMRFDTAAPAALRELMVTRAGLAAGAEYEWKHHWAAALDAGVPAAKLEALADWRGSALFDPLERAVLALADETATGTGACDATIGALKSHLSNEQVVELVIIAGFYAGVSRIVNSLQVPIEPGFESMLPHDETR